MEEVFWSESEEMELSELEEIERSLNIVLPEAYRAAVRNHPFAQYPLTYADELFDDPRAIICENLLLRDRGHSGYVLQPSQYQFGFRFDPQQGSLPLFFDISRPSLPVYLLIDGEVDLEAESFPDWIEQRLAFFARQQEKRKNEEVRKHRKWWQFWI
jgi:hypothetical protein